MKGKYYAKYAVGKQLQNTYRVFQEIDEIIGKIGAQPTALPSICIGNFQAGGTGKTPTVRWVAQQLQSRGYDPVIVLRGYRGSIKKPTRVKGHHTSAQVGDEALMHAADFPTFIGVNRTQACALASSHGADLNKPVIVLDDGLQHYKLKPDFKVVCTKSPQFWEDTLLPLGRLRQYPHNDIDAIIEINCKSEEHWERVPVYHLKHETTLLSGSRVPGLLIGGIAHPQTFFEQLKGILNLDHLESIPFKDHHTYSNHDLELLERRSEKYGFNVHCTLKDAVKLLPLIEQKNSPIQMHIWDIAIAETVGVESLMRNMVNRIEEVYKNRPVLRD